MFKCIFYSFFGLHFGLHSVYTRFTHKNIEMKSIQQWISEANEPIKSQAGWNIFKFPYANCLDKVSSFRSAILQGFIWAETPEGIAYWNEVFTDKQKSILF